MRSSLYMFAIDCTLSHINMYTRNKANHVVEERCDSVLHIRALLAHVDQGAFKESEAAVVECRAQFHELLAFQVLRTALLRVLPRDVTVVEVVVQHLRE